MSFAHRHLLGTARDANDLVATRNAATVGARAGDVQAQIRSDGRRLGNSSHDAVVVGEHDGSSRLIEKD